MLDQERCLIIGEVAQAHDGSLGMAHAFIDAIADAGADAVKFQTHIAAAESTPGEKWRIKFSKQDDSRYEYWQRMEFSEEHWLGLRQHADQRQIKFLSSPFSNEAIDLLERIDVPAWKVASGEVGSEMMLNRMLRTNKPILLSTGMSSIEEIDDAVELIKKKNVPFAIFQCTSSYPCAAEDVGLNMISFFQNRYDCPVGLSDHTGTIFPSLAAASLGAKLIEVHVTFSNKMFGPDVSSSVTFEEFETLVNGVRFVEKMLSNPVDKDAKSKTLKPMRDLFSKSLAASVDIKRGTIIEECHLAAKKPGTGIPEIRINEIIGKTAKNDIPTNQLLSIADIDGLAE